MMTCHTPSHSFFIHSPFIIKGNRRYLSQSAEECNCNNSEPFCPLSPIRFHKWLQAAAVFLLADRTVYSQAHGLFYGVEVKEHTQSSEFQLNINGEQKKSCVIK